MRKNNIVFLMFVMASASRVLASQEDVMGIRYSIERRVAERGGPYFTFWFCDFEKSGKPCSIIGSPKGYTLKKLNTISIREKIQGYGMAVSSLFGTIAAGSKGISIVSSLAKITPQMGLVTGVLAGVAYHKYMKIVRMVDPVWQLKEGYVLTHDLITGEVISTTDEKVLEINDLLNGVLPD